MELTASPALEVGQKLYRVKTCNGLEIMETYIEKVRVTIDVNENSDTSTEVIYFVHQPAAMRYGNFDEIMKNFFLSKKEILRRVTEQI